MCSLHLKYIVHSNPTALCAFGVTGQHVVNCFSRIVETTKFLICKRFALHFAVVVRNDRRMFSDMQCAHATACKIHIWGIKSKKTKVDAIPYVNLSDSYLSMLTAKRFCRLIHSLGCIFLTICCCWAATCRTERMGEHSAHLAQTLWAQASSRRCSSWCLAAAHCLRVDS